MSSDYQSLLEKFPVQFIEKYLLIADISDIKRTININMRYIINNKIDYPLIHGILHERTDLVDLFLELGSDPDMVASSIIENYNIEIKHLTALFIACGKSNIDVVLSLLRHGANPNLIPKRHIKIYDDDRNYLFEDNHLFHTITEKDRSLRELQEKYPPQSKSNSKRHVAIVPNDDDEDDEDDSSSSSYKSYEDDESYNESDEYDQSSSSLSYQYDFDDDEDDDIYVEDVDVDVDVVGNRDFTVITNDDEEIEDYEYEVVDEENVLINVLREHVLEENSSKIRYYLEYCQPIHPITQALRMGNYDYVQHLIAYGGNLNFDNDNLYATPLRGAIENYLSENILSLIPGTHIMNKFNRITLQQIENLFHNGLNISRSINSYIGYALTIGKTNVLNIINLLLAYCSNPNLEYGKRILEEVYTPLQLSSMSYDNSSKLALLLLLYGADFEYGPIEHILLRAMTFNNMQPQPRITNPIYQVNTIQDITNLLKYILENNLLMPDMYLNLTKALVVNHKPSFMNRPESMRNGNHRQQYISVILKMLGDKMRSIDPNFRMANGKTFRESYTEIEKKYFIKIV